MTAALRSQMSLQDKLELVPVLCFFEPFHPLLYLVTLCSPWSEEEIIPSLSTGMTFITFLLNPLFVRPNNPLSFYLHLWISVNFPFFPLWMFSVSPPRLEMQCWNLASLPAAVLWGLSSMKGFFHKHYRLCASLCTAVGVHLFLSQYLRAVDQNVFLKNFSLFSFSVCAMDYF